MVAREVGAPASYLAEEREQRRWFRVARVVRLAWGTGRYAAVPRDLVDAAFCAPPTLPPVRFLAAPQAARRGLAAEIPVQHRVAAHTPPTFAVTVGLLASAELAERWGPDVHATRWGAAWEQTLADPPQLLLVELSAIPDLPWVEHAVTAAAAAGIPIHVILGTPRSPARAVQAASPAPSAESLVEDGGDTFDQRPDPEGDTPVECGPDVSAHILALASHIWTFEPDFAGQVPNASVPATFLPRAIQPRLFSPRRATGGARDLTVAYAGPPPVLARTRHLVDGLWEDGLTIIGLSARDLQPNRWPARRVTRLVGPLTGHELAGALQAFRVAVMPAVAGRLTQESLEVAACGTPVMVAHRDTIVAHVGPESAAVLTGEPEHLLQSARSLAGSAVYAERHAVLAAREMRERHTTAQRWGTILTAAALGDVVETGLRPPSISVLLSTNRPDRVSGVLELLAAQTHRNLELVLVAHAVQVDTEAMRRAVTELGIPHLVLRYVPRDRSLGSALNAGVAAASGTYIAKWDDDDYYGPAYLADQVAAFVSTDATIVGKHTRYVHFAESGAVILQFPDREHTYVERVTGATMMLPREVLVQHPFPDLARGEDTQLQAALRAQGALAYGTDRFNFVVRRSAVGRHTWSLEESQLLANGGQLSFYGDPISHVTV